MPENELSLIETGPLGYLLSVPPPSSTAAEPRPVLCFLHGYDEAAPMDIRRALTLHGPLSASSAPAAARDFVVVAPQLPGAGDVWRLHAPEVREVVEQVRRERGGDPARTYLTGFSFGGNGVFDLALEQPDLWAALWPVDPTRVPVRDPERPVWLSSGEISRWRGTAFAQRLRLEPPGTPLPERIVVDRGLDHVGTAAEAYADERIYDWLLAARLPNGS